MDTATTEKTTNGNGNGHDSNPLLVFMPSGRRGRFPVGTPILQAARSLGVDIETEARRL